MNTSSPYYRRTRVTFPPVYLTTEDAATCDMVTTSLASNEPDFIASKGPPLGGLIRWTGAIAQGEHGEEASGELRRLCAAAESPPSERTERAGGVRVAKHELASFRSMAATMGATHAALMAGMVRMARATLGGDQTPLRSALVDATCQAYAECVQALSSRPKRGDGGRGPCPTCRVETTLRKDGQPWANHVCKEATCTE